MNTHLLDRAKHTTADGGERFVLYAAPDRYNAVLSRVFVCNTGSETATYTMYLEKAGAVESDQADAVIFEKTIAAKETQQVLHGLAMSPGEALVVDCTHGFVNFQGVRAESRANVRGEA